MLHPTTAAALVRARQDDVERMLRDPRYLARQEARLEHRPSTRSHRRSRLSDVRRVVSAAIAPRTASRTA